MSSTRLNVAPSSSVNAGPGAADDRDPGRLSAEHERAEVRRRQRMVRGERQPAVVRDVELGAHQPVERARRRAREGQGALAAVRNSRPLPPGRAAVAAREHVPLEAPASSSSSPEPPSGSTASGDRQPERLGTRDLVAGLRRPARSARCVLPSLVLADAVRRSGRVRLDDFRSSRDPRQLHRPPAVASIADDRHAHAGLDLLGVHGEGRSARARRDASPPAGGTAPSRCGRGRCCARASPGSPGRTCDCAVSTRAVDRPVAREDDRRSASPGGPIRR